MLDVCFKCVGPLVPRSPLWLHASSPKPILGNCLQAKLVIDVPKDEADRRMQQHTHNLTLEGGVLPAHLGEGTTLHPAQAVHATRCLFNDAETLLNTAVTHYLAALKLFDASEVPCPTAPHHLLGIILSSMLIKLR